MMRVDGAGGQRPELPEQNNKKRKTGAAGSTGASSTGGADETETVDFSKTFIDKAAQRITVSLDQLIQSLSLQGEALVRKQTFQELEKYKLIVQDFLTKVTQELYRLKESGDPRKGGKVYIILQKVDAQMDFLTKEILARQTPQLNIMKRLDQIRGLLMDLYK